MADIVFKPEFVHSQPEYMTLEKIRSEAPSDLTGSSLPGVYGFTVPGFEFPDDNMKGSKLVGNSPLQWKFEGTVLILRIRPVMTLPSQYRQWPDVLEVIAKHEKVHVHDAQEIIRGPLQHRLKSDAMFKEFFIDRKLIPDVTYRHMFPDKIKDYVRAIFLGLWNPKVADRDSPANYAPVEYAVGQALRRHHH
jgi:hypothetical protein